ncbi:MAG: hypothetical protein AABX32_06865 [Nanoarchaeota archaeon]
MALQLNEQVAPYHEFYGRNTEQMPLLVRSGRVPMSVAGLMDRRLEVRDTKYSPEVRAAWHDNYFDTGDGILYHPDGKIKIVPDAQVMRGISSQSKLSDGALVSPAGAYEAAQGAEFTKEDLRKIIKDSLTREGAKANPVWQALARDQNRLNAYVDFVFDEAQRRFSYDRNMGIYVGSAQKEPTGRLVYVNGLELRSNADGRSHLGINNGRLVGVAPEARVAQNAAAQTLEQRV